MTNPRLWVFPLAVALALPRPCAAQAPARHTIDADGHPLAVWEKRAPDARAAVLLLHGRTWSTLPDFDLQVEGQDLSLMDGLVAAGMTAYGVDLRGYGATPRDETGWNTPDRAAADTERVLEWIRARAGEGTPVHLFGWSYGSMVSQLVAQRRPALVDRMVLFGYPWTPGDSVPVATATDAPPARPTTAAAAASDFITEGAIDAVAIDAYVAAALAADPVRADWTSLHEWNALDPARVTVPTLVLEGEHDPYTPEEAQAALFRGLATPDKAWVIVPGGDHAAFLERPRPYFLAVLRGFLSGGYSSQR